MWTFNTKTGELSKDGAHVSAGYSGHGVGVNNPLMQDVPNVGPLPAGEYTIGPAHTDGDKGPCVMALVPSTANLMHGRAGFLIHGDSISAPGSASHGCIILARTVREQIAESADRALRVVAGA